MWNWGDRVKTIPGIENRWTISHRLDALGIFISPGRILSQAN